LLQTAQGASPPQPERTMKEKRYEEDDGRTIADMSGIEPQPMLMPSASSIKKLREGRDEPDVPGRTAQKYDYGPEQLDREGRRAAIGGAISAWLLIGGLVFAAFAVVILVIGHLS